MHRSEHDQLIVCADCGAQFSLEEDRGYGFDDDDGGICFDCTVKRGGVYDGLYECWVTPPRLDSLMRERER